MTKEEARLTLQDNFGYLSQEHPRILEALRVALDALSQPCLPSNLDEVAKKIAYDVCKALPNGEEKDTVVYYAILAAIAGAKWMSKQGFSFQDEVIFCGSTPFLKDADFDILEAPESFKPGDKVIVQIRKKQ